MKFENYSVLIMRLLVAPFVFGIMVVVHLYHAIARWVLYLRYGGEFIEYTVGTKQTIRSCFEAITNGPDENA